jgi:hypothetical protein
MRGRDSGNGRGLVSVRYLQDCEPPLTDRPGRGDGWAGRAAWESWIGECSRRAVRESIPFEVAGPKRGAEILRAWGVEGQRAPRASLLLDFPFLVAYSVLNVPAHGPGP